MAKCETCGGSGISKICPRCGKNLIPVVQSAACLLNKDQFSSSRAGDYYCQQCPDKNRGKSRMCYWWKSELPCPNCQQGEFVPDASILKELNDKQAKEIQRLTKARKRLADAYRKLRDESMRAADRLGVLEKAGKKIMIGFDPPKFNPDELVLGKNVKFNLHDPETAYCWGWHGAILECGEILAKATLGEKNGKE